MALTGRLLIVAPADASATDSAELRYLEELRALQARRVFARVDRLDRPPRRADAAAADAILVLTSPHVLLMAPTLEALRARLAEGAGVAVPRLLSESAPHAGEGVHTLRGFEAVENAVLSPGAKSAPGGAVRTPVALLSGAAFAAVAERLATWPPAGPLVLDEGDRERLGVAFAGLAHEFTDYYGEARADVLRFIPAHAADVIEVGCARGATGALLQERLGCRVTGVELNPVVAREAARVLHRVVCGDFERVEIGGAFDVVLATELLEHLVDPLAFFARARRLLRPGGRIVLSTPNVGHHSIVEALLAGRWDYLPIGLQCVTHVRWFTASTLRDWLEMAGFSRYELVPQTTGLPDRFRALAGAFAVDEESLGTSGFYVVIDV